MRKKNGDPSLALRLIERARIAQSTAPMEREVQVDLGIAYREALQAVMSGSGTEVEAHTLACGANVALILCEHGFGTEYLEAVKAAQRAIVALMARGRACGRWVLDGPGIRACQELVELHEAQMDMPECTQGLVSAVMVELHRRIAIGAVMEPT
jgi:hypothetical protein